MIKLPDRRHEEIKRIIVRMFAEYGISCVPISGFTLAHKTGIKVILYSAIAPSKRWLLHRRFCPQKRRLPALFLRNCRPTIFTVRGLIPYLFRRPAFLFGTLAEDPLCLFQRIGDLVCGEVSNGMILAADCSEDDVKVLFVDPSVPAGSRIH